MNIKLNSEAVKLGGFSLTAVKLPQGASKKIFLHSGESSSFVRFPLLTLMMHDSRGGHRGYQVRAGSF